MAERKEYNDTETIEMLDQIYGKGNWSGLNTPEKRECWQYGYDNTTIRTGKFSNPDTDKERFHPLMLGGNKNITDDKLDAYYICLGQFAPRLCLRCSHTWSAVENIPQTCPNKACRSPYWNKPRLKGVVASAELYRRATFPKSLIGKTIKYYVQGSEQSNGAQE